MRIIGVHGKARSGKNEFSNILSMSYGFKTVAFAKKVKDFGIKYFGLTKELTEHKTKESRTIIQGIGNSVRERALEVKTYLEVQSTKTELGISNKYPIWVEEIACEEFCIEPVDLKTRKKLVHTICNGIKSMFTENISFFDKYAEGNSKNIWINYLFSTLKDDCIYLITDLRYANEKEHLKNNGGIVVKINRVDCPLIEANSKHISETDLEEDLDWDHVVVNEHKSDWYSKLSLSGSNLIRKLVSLHFINENDIKMFKVKIN